MIMRWPLLGCVLAAGLFGDLHGCAYIKITPETVTNIVKHSTCCCQDANTRYCGQNFLRQLDVATKVCNWKRVQKPQIRSFHSSLQAISDSIMRRSMSPSTVSKVMIRFFHGTMPASK